MPSTPPNSSGTCRRPSGRLPRGSWKPIRTGHPRPRRGRCRISLAMANLPGTHGPGHACNPSAAKSRRSSITSMWRRRARRKAHLTARRFRMCSGISVRGRTWASPRRERMRRRARLPSCCRVTGSTSPRAAIPTVQDCLAGLPSTLPGRAACTSDPRAAARGPCRTSRSCRRSMATSLRSACPNSCSSNTRPSFPLSAALPSRMPMY